MRAFRTDRGDHAGRARRRLRTEHLGRSNIVDCRPVEGPDCLHEQQVIQIETDATAVYEPGAVIALSAPAEAIRVFGEDGSLLGS